MTTTTDKVQIEDSTTGTSTSTSYTIGSKPQAERGWECPRCGRINAPWVRQCDCPKNWNITWDSPDTEDWWKRVYCDSDTFKVHPETTTWKAPNSILGMDSATTAQTKPNENISAWASSATSVNSPWNKYSTLTAQINEINKEIEKLKENK